MFVKISLKKKHFYLHDNDEDPEKNSRWLRIIMMNHDGMLKYQLWKFKLLLKNENPKNGNRSKECSCSAFG